jgi:RNA polymerase-binding transcription factor DksA
VIYEKCADEQEMASQAQLQANELARERQSALERQAVQVVQAAIDDGTFDEMHCVVCEVEIPAARLAMTKMHCTLCAQAIEDKKKRMGR